MGKSFALRYFAKSLNPSLYHMEYICLSTVSVMEFYCQFCSVPGAEPRGGKPSMFRTVQEQILYLHKDKKQPLLLAVDEAQYLSTSILEDIKILMNYGYDSLNCFTLILCGEPPEQHAEEACPRGPEPAHHRTLKLFRPLRLGSGAVRPPQDRLCRGAPPSSIRRHLLLSTAIPRGVPAWWTT
nr:ATP-binding protein [uncultured Acetatifactor sp.]